METPFLHDGRFESTRGAPDVQMGDAVIVWRSEEAPAGQTVSGEHASCQNAQRKGRIC